MKIAVAINVYDEPAELVQACVDGASKFLGEVEVFLDDPARRDIELFSRLGVPVNYRAESCGNNRLWHRWWLDMLAWFDRSGADLCFKIDPDTRVLRSPAHFPDADYFGTPERLPWGTFIQGGCTGLTREAVRCIAPCLQESCSTSPWFTHSYGDPSVFIDDQKIGVLMAHLGIPPAPWSECLCRWRDPVSHAEAAPYAIVHPSI